MSDTHGPGVRLPPPVAVVVVLALAWLLNRLWPLQGLPQAPGAGLVVGLVAGGWVGWALLAMLRAGNNPRPDRPDTVVVQSGPFRFGRNPFYLGFVGIALGVALAWGSLWAWAAALVIFLWLDRAVVRPEEVYLRHKFGAAYTDYAARVRRWL